MTPQERHDEFLRLVKMLDDGSKHCEDKVALAQQTYDSIDRQCRRLDEELARFDYEKFVGPKYTGGNENRLVVV